MIQFTPGMRVMIRDEEWMVEKVEKNTLGHQVLHCVGVSTLVKETQAIFLTDMEAEIVPCKCQ